MELECRGETVTRWETVSGLSIEREESGEMIVPDACPDVGEVLLRRPRLFLQRREAMEGRGEFSGLIRVGILYRPEEGEGIASMEVTLPFSATAEDKGLTKDCVLRITPSVLSADVHLLNSRKVLVKVVYRLEGEALCPRNETVVSLVEDPLPWGIRQKTEEENCFLPVSVQEKAFTCQDTLTLSDSLPEPEKVLFTEGRCLCREARVLGDRLIFKGETVLDLLCLDEDGEPFSARLEVPFSQVMDGESEGDVCRVSLLLTDISCVADPADRRSFTVDLSLTAQGEVCRSASVPMLSDLYSTAYDLDVQREEASFSALRIRDEAQETARVILPGKVETCENVSVTLGRASLRKEGEDQLLEQTLRVSALCSGENGPVGMEKTELVTHRVPNGEGSRCLWTAELSGDPASNHTGEGLEVTVPLTFRWLLLEERTAPVIRQVTVGEKLVRGEDAPSLVIRSVREGQTLWDIAKAHAAAQEDIMAASGLTEEELYPGQLLLIPRSAG